MKEKKENLQFTKTNKMKMHKQYMISTGIAIILLAVIFPLKSYGQLPSQTAWFNSAQERIDTLRKGDFGIQILDKNGQPFTGNVSVRMKTHEYPFGIAFDFYEGSSATMGSSYTTSETITANLDAEIYKSERWSDYLSYAIPVEIGKDYKVTLKFAEIYLTNSGSRIFDVKVNGQLFLDNYDVFAEAGGKDIAVDTSILVSSTKNEITIDLLAISDNASIKGIEVTEDGGPSVVKINCGGGALTTTDGNVYVPEDEFFNQSNYTIPSKEDWMKAAMYKYFNYGVTGNSFKWSGIQPQHTAPNYTNFENAVRWTQKVGWDLRAHTLLWGGNDAHSMPDWVRNLPTPKDIIDTCEMRVTREMTRYKGIVKEYDVINEPLSGHADWLRNEVGDSILWQCFQWAHAADPDAEIYINDYQIVFGWGQSDEYLNLIKNIQQMGGPISGVGFQAHFWDCCRPNIDEIVNSINKIATTGLPIKFTEYDWGKDLTHEQQVEDFLKVLTIAFSHPSMVGMICWGLSDDGAWRENSGFFDANHIPKPAADTLLYYTKVKWATNFDAVMTNGNTIDFNAYYGDYDIEVDFGDTVKYFTIPCLKDNADSIFVLHEADAQIKGPEYQYTKMLNDTSFIVAFDKPVSEESIRLADFQFFSQNPVLVQNIKVSEADSNNIVVILEDKITPEDYLSFHYFPGSLSSKDGGMAKSFGPEEVINFASGIIDAFVINNGDNVEAVYNGKVRNLIENQSNFTIFDNGSEIEITDVEYTDTDSTKALFTLASPLTSSSKPTISYNGGTMESAANFKCQNTENLKVTNTWPKVVSAEVNASGTKVIVLFNTELSYVKENLDAFVILAGDQSLTLTGVTITGTDSSIVTFRFSEVIEGDANVYLSYEPGTVEGANGNQMVAISDKRVSNKSTGIEDISKEMFTVYPVPAFDNLNVVNKTAPFNVKLINALGTEIFSGVSESESFQFDVSQYESGIYFIKITDNHNKIGIQKIILK